MQNLSKITGANKTTISHGCMGFQKNYSPKIKNKLIIQSALWALNFVKWRQLYGLLQINHGSG
ncbi:MAG: hypothetical protein IT261_11500 [Saprospiraceae bacterium]|nr:hypothetical protein [Saprospiraceae bacterium]